MTAALEVTVQIVTTLAQIAEVRMTAVILREVVLLEEAALEEEEVLIHGNLDLKSVNSYDDVA